MTIRRRFGLLALVATGLCACGPTLGTDVGLKQAGAPIFFSQPTPAQPPPASPPVALNPMPNFPAPLEEPPLFGFSPVPVLPPAAASACPTAAPGAVIAAPTVPAPPSAPANAAPYPFRYSGTKTLDPGRPDMEVTTLPASGTRQVHDSATGTADVAGPVPANTGKVETFSVTEEFDGTRTTNEYVIYPQGVAGTTAAQQTGQQPAAGLYLEKMTTENLDGSNASTFTPDPPVELMPLPANGNIGSTFESAGTDSQLQGGESMVLPPTPGSAITGDVHVDACGVLLDAWQVTINGFLANTLLANQPAACPAGAAGNTGSPGCTPFTLVLDIGTQYGGISLSDHLTEDGYDSTLDKPYVYDVTATVDRAPYLVSAL